MKDRPASAELAEYVKERQAKAVRGLRQHWQRTPRLLVVVKADDLVAAAVMSTWREYADDILVDVEQVQAEDSQRDSRVKDEKTTAVVCVLVEGVDVPKNKDVFATYGDTYQSPLTLAVAWFESSGSIADEDLRDYKKQLSLDDPLVVAALFENVITATRAQIMTL